MRGSAGQPSRVFQMGADIAIILSVGPMIQAAEFTVHDIVVRELSHRKQGWVSIMKPIKKKGGDIDEKKLSITITFNIGQGKCGHTSFVFMIFSSQSKKKVKIPCFPLPTCFVMFHCVQKKPLTTQKQNCSSGISSFKHRRN